MPLREYVADDGQAGCPACRTPFERLESAADEPLRACPRCGAAVRRVISAPRVGGSQTGFDQRAKSAGFHKLQRIGQGEYEKKY